MSDFDLCGKTAVVTGGGRGIGAGIATAFARAGASVVVAARTTAEIESVAVSIRSAGGEALAVRADVTDAFALGTLATAAVDEFGHLDIWVNNAGGTSVGRALADLSRAEWDQCLALNFTAMWEGAMAAVEQMHWGAIINISSAASMKGLPGIGAYAACKAAVNSLTRTMANELAPDIRVNAIAPGRIPTQLFFDAVDAEQLDVDHLARDVPLGLGTPDDIGHAAVYLASDAARWVTGQTIEVAGGRTIA